MSLHTNIFSSQITEKSTWTSHAGGVESFNDEKIKISNTTFSKRKQLSHLIDEFTDFTWDGLDAFRNFGAFIINEKRESLKFYNGPSFTNEYTNPQFDRSNIFTGVTFKSQQISFKIGVYWISIEDYRKLLNWLNPYVIGNLVFDFNRDYSYQVKLASREDSTRYIVGREDNEPRYYTEMTLSFDVQGVPCARMNISQNWIVKLTNTEVKISPNVGKDNIEKTWASDLEFPFKITMGLNLQQIAGKNFNLTMGVYHKNGGGVVRTLFNIGLQNLPKKDGLEMFLEYDSESGLLYEKIGDDSAYNILNRLNNINGEQIVQYMNVNKFNFPGLLDYPDFNLSDYEIRILTTGGNLAINDIIAQTTTQDSNGNDITNYKVNFEAYSRTNVI